MNGKERSVGFKSSKTVEADGKITVTVNVVPGGFPMLLFLLFLILKLTGSVSWSWLWISAPLWGTVVFTVFAALVLAIKTVKKKDDHG